MAPNPLRSAFDLALAPARLAGRLAGGVLREATGSRQSDVPVAEPPPVSPAAGAASAPQRARPRARPKPLDDVTIARKVETTIFRDIDVDKGKIDVNVVEGVVWLRGEARRPDLINQLEERTREIPEVRGVENLLHLPKTDAPSRTDTPSPQRKTRRSKTRPEQQSVTPGKVTEEAPDPPVAEPSPRKRAASGKGKGPAPMGSTPKRSAKSNDDPDTSELDKDPAYQPEDPGLRDLKGG